MANNDATDFSVIEASKENIQPLASGRSARALASVLTPRADSTPQGARGIQSVARAAFEKEVLTASELDDPLEVWVRYFQWTLETFPSGNSAESGMLSLLERATKEFLHEPQYKNDPRYLKMWIHYIQNYSDAPREHFAYLARHDIGQRLALFYEEFAGLLESLGRRTQAGEIYQRGIENNARPTERLLRKYEEFMDRLAANPPDANEPSSPAIPAVRPALASKSVPFAATSGSPDPQAPRGIPSSTSSKPAKKNKLQIFQDSDADPPVTAASSGSTKGWDSIGTIGHRKKENVQEPRPWAGETLKQDTKPVRKEKLMVFKDTSNTLSSSSTAQAQMQRRSERQFADIASMYPDENDPTEEYSFEELRAMSRGLYGIDWKMLREDEEEERRLKSRRQRQEQERAAGGFNDSHTPVKVKTVLSPSPRKGKVKRKKNVGAEPTMTLHTRAATDEIYSMFNQPLDGGIMGPDQEEDSDYEPSDDDYTCASFGNTTMNLGARLKDVAQHGAEEEEESDGDDDGNRDDTVHSAWSDFTAAEISNVSQTKQDENIPPKKGKLAIHRDENDVPPPRKEKLSIHRDENDFPGVETKMTKLAIHRDENDAPPRPQRRLEIPPPPEGYDPPTARYYDAEQAEIKRLPFMTPITEVTESFPATTVRRKHDAYKTPLASRSMGRGSYESSPENASGSEPTMANEPLPSIKEILKEKGALKERSVTAHAQEKAILPPAKPVIDPSAKGKPIINDLQVVPTEDYLRQEILDKIQPPLATFEGFSYHPGMKFGKTDAIRKYAKAMSRKDSDKTSTIPAPLTLKFPSSKVPYHVKKELGKGTFAPVYLLENSLFSEESSDDENELGIVAEMRSRGRSRFEAVKMEHPPTAWEYYIISTAKRRLGTSRATESIVSAHEFHLFDDECYLILDYLPQGTLVDLVNIAKNDPTSTTGGALDEQLVMFLSIELLRTLEGLHAKGVIHGDLKADNCLVRFASVPDTAWSSRYHADGSFGWDKKGMVLIDFGRGIDMRVFQPKVQFIADWKPDATDCAEIREMRPWTYQIDYHGAAGVIHTLLFGKYIETVVDRSDAIVGGTSKRYKISSSLKRYWQQDIWSEVFDVLLNPMAHAQKEGGELPVCNALRRCRNRMEEWLEGNSERGAGLKSLVRKMEASLGKRK